MFTLLTVGHAGCLPGFALILNKRSGHQKMDWKLFHHEATPSGSFIIAKLTTAQLALPLYPVNAFDIWCEPQIKKPLFHLSTA